MARRTTVTHTLDDHARVALFMHTTISPERAIQLTQADLTYACLLNAGVTDINCMAAHVGPHKLARMGAPGAAGLRALGFDSISLRDADFCNEALVVFGAVSMVAAFVTCATDAVAVADATTARRLGLTVQRLLELCVEKPAEALEVIHQWPPPTGLADVPANVLLATGLRATALGTAGHTLPLVIAQMSPTTSELARLGYGLRTRRNTAY